MIEILYHDGTKKQTKIDNYDAKAVYEDIKAAQSSTSNDHMVLIGDVIVDARSIKSVSKVS